MENEQSAYRKKPVVVEAIQWFKIGDHPKVLMRDNTGGPQPMVWSLEGWHVVEPGYWIVKGVKGEYYGVRPDIFEATYEPAAALSEQGTRDAKDAARYRWLREPNQPRTHRDDLTRLCNCCQESGDELDASIDEEMQQPAERAGP